MTLRSMTGFAQAEGAAGDLRWRWEVRSVNGRGLDVRTRLAPGFEALELKVRECVARRLSRGNVSLTLTVQRDTADGELRLNPAALTSVLAALAELRSKGDFDRPRPEAVLALRGVLEPIATIEDETKAAARHEALLRDLDLALLRLNEARGGEGGRLATVMLSQLATIEALTAKAAVSPARTPERIKARLREQLSRILDAAPALDETRLNQEAALIATKADIEEEITRLGAHIAAARELLLSSDPAGRKLDFLTQEFNREANTLCSKANDVEITRIGLELKAVIDQMREQVQNIE